MNRFRLSLQIVWLTLPLLWAAAPWSVARAHSPLQYAFWPSSLGGNDHAYQFVAAGIPFDAARAEAMTLSFAGVPGDLATVHSAAENAVLNSILVASGRSNGWIGLHQPSGSLEPAGNFQWISGEPVTYTNWSSDQPDNSGGSENHVTLERPGVWNDVNQNSYFSSYFVEYPTAGTLRGALVPLSYSPLSQLTVEFFHNGNQLPTVLTTPLVGQVDSVVIYDNSMQPVGFGMTDSLAALANDVAGSLDLGAAGGLDFALTDSTINVKLGGGTGAFRPVDDDGQIAPDAFVLDFLSGRIDSTPTGPLADIVNPSSLLLDLLGAFSLNDFVSNAAPFKIEISPSAVSEVYDLTMRLPLVTELTLASSAADQVVARYTIDLVATGQFTAVPEPTTAALAIIAALALSVFASRSLRPCSK